MKNVILATCILLVAVAAIAYLYFSSISVGSKSNDKALAYIPQSAAILLTFDNDKSFYDIFKGYKLFNTIIGDKKQQEFDFLKQNILNDPDIKEITGGQSVYLSVHPSDTVSFLWLIPLTPASLSADMELILTENSRYTGRKTGIQNNPVIELNISELNKKLYVFINDGVVLGSFSKNLIEECLNDSVPKISQDFIKQISQSGQKNENSLINLFTDNLKIPGFINQFLRRKIDDFPLFKDLQGFSTLSMNYRSDALLFNGITNTDTGQISYTNLFLHQKPVQNQIKRILPINTANYVSYGLSDYDRFHTDLKKLFSERNQLASLNEIISNIAKETGINPERDIRKFWGKEFATFQLSNHEQLAAIRVTNGRQLQFFLEPLSNTYNEDIRRFNNSNLLYFYFGDALKSFAKPFFIVTDNHLVVANNPQVLVNFLEYYNSQRLIYTTDRFMNFEQLMAEQSNITVFIHHGNSKSILNYALKRQYPANFNDEGNGPGPVYGLCYQWSSDGSRYLTNLYLGYRYDEETVAESDPAINENVTEPN